MTRDQRDLSIATLVLCAAAAIATVLSTDAEVHAWTRGWTDVRDAYGCPGLVLAAGTVDAAEHQLREGYFAIGAATVLLNPNGIPWTQMRPLVGRAEPRELVIRPVKCPRDLQKLEDR